MNELTLTLENKTAIVTGATSGIGKSITAELARQGSKLCLLGRNIDRLKSLTKSLGECAHEIRYYPTDLAIDSDVQSTITKIKKDLPEIDILIHSAGSIVLNRIEDASVEDFDLQFKINVRAPFSLTQAFLPKIKESMGHIIFINSSSGLRAGANTSQYSATKHALKAFADSLRQEVNQYGIRVLSLFPGRTATPMQKYIYEDEGRDYNPDLLMQPIDVAKMVLHILNTPPTIETTDVMVRPAIKSY